MSSDDEKWANIVGNCDDDDDDSGFMANNNDTKNVIHLQRISPEEMKSFRPIKVTKKLKKNQYFVSDVCTTLSVEDIQYQLLNTSDIVNKNTIPEIFIKGSGKPMYVISDL